MILIELALFFFLLFWVPGRFDREIAMTMPDDRARAQILRTMTRSMRLQGDFDFDYIARKTPGFVFRFCFCFSCQYSV